MKMRKWLETLIEEKGLDQEQIMEVEGPSGTNFMPLSMVVDAICATTDDEQKAIKKNLVKLDFYNRNIMDYFKHLAQALAK